MYKLIVSGLTAGQEILIDGVGVLGNGTHDVSDEQAETFRQLNSVHNPENPTLLQAFSKHENVKVETVKESSPAKADDNEKKGGDK
jgi:hypothetical protein